MSRTDRPRSRATPSRTRRAPSRARRAPVSPASPSRHGTRAPLDRSALLIPLLAALLAVAVRIPSLGWGLPDVEEEALPMKKALDMGGWSTGRIDWNPRTAGWPSLSFYLHLLLQHLHFAAGRLLGVFSDRGDYFVEAWVSPGAVLVVSRSLGVLAAAAIAGLGARLSQRLCGAWAGALTGALLALSPRLVEHSQLVEPDILMALFAALAVDRVVAIHLSGRSSDDVWSGVWIGLGASTKYTPVLLAPALWVAHLLRPRSRARQQGRGPWLRPLVALVAAAIAFSMTSPFLLLDLATVSRDLAYQAVHMTAGHFGQARALGPLSYVSHVLGPGLGWGGFVLCVAGLAWGAWRLGGPWWVIVACILPYWLGLGFMRTHFARYLLPIFMPLAVGLGGMVAMIRGVPEPKLRFAALALATVIALAPAAEGTWRYHASKARPSTQQLANRFLERAAANESPSIVAEVLSLSLPTARVAQAFDEKALLRLTPGQRARLLGRKTYEVTYLPMYTVEPELTAFYYDLRHVAAYDYVAISDGVRSRYLADTVRFGPQARFYRDLESHARMLARFAPGDSARGPEIRIYALAPEALDALWAERGPAPLLHDSTAAGPLHPPDYVRFVEGAARAAYARGSWTVAARYYRGMLEYGRTAGMNEIEQLRLVRHLAGIEQRAGRLEEARRLYEAFLARVPDDTASRARLEEIRRALAR